MGWMLCGSLAENRHSCKGIKKAACIIFQGRNEAYYDSFDPVVLDKILIPDPEIFKKIDPWSQNYYWSHTPHSL